MGKVDDFKLFKKWLSRNMPNADIRINSDGGVFCNAIIHSMFKCYRAGLRKGKRLSNE